MTLQRMTKLKKSGWWWRKEYGRTEKPKRGQDKLYR